MIQFNSPMEPSGAGGQVSTVALLLIDVINDLEFEGGEKLLPSALVMARHLAALKRRAKQAGVPAIYFNDNFGRWRSDFRCQVEHCLDEGMRGHEIARMLHPETDDYFVLKPRHSGFYASSLEVLLSSLKSTTLILTGMAGNICVLYTANDAYMRGFDLVVPPDCIASNESEQNQQALRQIQSYLKAKILPSEEIDLSPLIVSLGGGTGGTGSQFPLGTGPQLRLE